MRPHEVVAKLSATTSRTEKEQILREAWEAGCIDFFAGARVCYNKLLSFGVKQVPLSEGSITNWSCSWNKFSGRLAQPLHHREFTGSAAHDAIKDFMDEVSPDEWNGFYRLVLLRDLDCGVSDKTINKVLKEIAKSDPKAEEYTVPVFSCQLAHQGEKHMNKIRGRKLLDVKLDGVRILAVINKEAGKVTLHTRNGLTNTNFPQIEELLQEKLMDVIPHSIVLDGEMISESYQKLMTQLNRKRFTDTSDAKFAVFDALPLSAFMGGLCTTSQTDRDELANLLCEKIGDERVFHIPKIEVDLATEEGYEAFKKFNHDALEAGAEGIMVKDPDAYYHCKRSHAWLKLKPVITVDLKIVGMNPGGEDTKYKDCLGAFVCEGHDQGKDLRADVGGGFTDEQREEFWANKDQLIGQTVEVLADKISQNQDGTYSLRFPRFVRFRDDK